MALSNLSLTAAAEMLGVEPQALPEELQRRLGRIEALVELPDRDVMGIRFPRLWDIATVIEQWERDQRKPDA